MRRDLFFFLFSFLVYYFLEEEGREIEERIGGEGGREDEEMSERKIKKET